MSFENFNIIDWSLLGVLAVSFIAQVYIYARYLSAPAREMRKRQKYQVPSDQEQSDKEAALPPVSIIICAHNESYNLSQYLQTLLTQDYPEYEVIIVDDGSEDETRAVLDTYMVRDPRLHMTFVPYGARVGSTKKLALTLGAKAAQYDYLLLTDADCVPESNRWIREMMKGFDKVPSDKGPTTKEIVLGFGAYFEEAGHVNRLVRYDTLFNGLHYLGAALCGHPYMGVGRNLAYRKSLFFNSGGFTKLMTNIAGDDDLFVNHVATKANTAVVLSRDSYTWSIAKTTIKDWWQQKRRHLSVSPSYKTETKLRLAIEPLTRGLFYAAFVGLIIYNIYSLPIALSLFLVRWIMQTVILNLSAHRMGLKGFAMGSILWFDIVLPLVNLWMLTVPRRYKNIW